MERHGRRRRPVFNSRPVSGDIEGSELERHGRPRRPVFNSRPVSGDIERSEMERETGGDAPSTNRPVNFVYRIVPDAHYQQRPGS